MNNLFHWRKNTLTSLDIVDKLWDLSTAIANGETEDFITSTTTWQEFCSRATGTSVEKWLADLSAKRFKFETMYLKSKPNRKSMVWMYGDDVVSLFDIFACKKHRGKIRTSNFAGEHTPEYVTVFCPHCNADNFKSPEKMSEYMADWGYMALDDLHWNVLSKMSKRYKREIRWSNFVYRLKRFFGK